MIAHRVLADSFLRAAITSTEAASSWLDNTSELSQDAVADLLCGMHADHQDWRMTHETSGEYLYEMFVATQPHFAAP